MSTSVTGRKRRLVALECPHCKVRFTRDKYVTCWLGDSEEALERQLRATLTRLGMRCDPPCNTPVGEFVTVWHGTREGESA